LKINYYTGHNTRKAQACFAPEVTECWSN